MYLNTLYTVKADGTKKARTVLIWREKDCDEPMYPDTFFPTTRPTTCHTLCALTAMLKWTIRGCDLKQAYLQADWPAHQKKVKAHMMHGYQKHHNGTEYVRRRQSFAEAQT
eukprot:3403132-Prymnesium_polylepis.1